MANGQLDNNTSNLTGSFTLTKQSGTVLSLKTKEKYGEKDINLTLDAQTASPSFTGGDLSSTHSAVSTNCAISGGTNNSGVSITTSYSMTRANVTYNGAVDGWVSKSNGAIALSENTASPINSTYYINGVTLTTPSSGTRQFDITIPNGDSSTLTLHFTVDSSGNTTIT